MAKIPFVKVESLGNDFVIVEPASARSRWSSERAVAICDRRSGVGADGLILLGPAVRDGIRFRLYNADGSSAEWSGNGVRGVGAYLAAMNPRQREFHLDTPIGCVRVCAKRRPGGGVAAEISRPMPPVEAVTTRQARQIAAMIGRQHLAGPVFVDAGNPHWVFVVSGFDYEWEPIGEECQLANHRTGGINVEFTRVVNRRRLDLRLFERGVGPTPSSGTGALAVVAACQAMGLVDRSVRIDSPGGSQLARLSPSGQSVILEAPARIVMAGVWSDGVIAKGKKR